MKLKQLNGLPFKEKNYYVFTQTFRFIHVLVIHVLVLDNKCVLYSMT